MPNPQADQDPPKINRNQRRRERTREIIMEAADKVFREKGVDEATVNDITDHADIAYGSFYNHFKTRDEVVEALAEATIRRVADRTSEILGHADRVELLPCIGARVIMRMLAQDPAMRWMLKRPYIFVEELYKVASPFMLNAEREAVADGRLKPAGGHECWLRMYPWMLLSELGEAVETGNIAAHEERFAAVSLRFLGIDDALAPELIKRSRILVRNAGLPDL